MKREILFRGKHDPRYGTDWCYGVPYTDYAGDCIMATGGCKQIVIEETVGQYTGLTDKNGVKIFEGDVCRFQNVFSSKPHIGVVRYYASAKPISDDGQYSVDLAECNSEDLEVIGNIHDNPGMLGGK